MAGEGPRRGLRLDIQGSGLHLYFARHGESEANILQQFSNRPGKHPLTEKGHRQAKALADRLRDASIKRIYSSPVMRAAQTAEILSTELGIPFSIDEALREFDVGVLEGRSDEASWDIYRAVVEAWMTRREWERRIEGGESFVDIMERFLPFLWGLVRTHRSTSGGIVLVGHGGTYRCMLPLVFKNVDFEFAAEHGLDAAGLIEGRPGSQGLICLSWREPQLGKRDRFRQDRCKRNGSCSVP